MLAIFLNLFDSEEDKTKFETLYYKYRNLMMSVAIKKLNDFNLAEDCVQEAFFYISKNFNKVRSIDSIKTKNFFATIVNGFAITRFNREHKATIVSTDKNEEYADSVIADSVENFSFNDYSEVELCMLINCLDEEKRNYLYLKY
ncbi:MAG: sigma-70 family RNA polymerase sigma factor, partial [Clostridiales bacterium]|nr:sigma-70 family RNA polymerase sigma factor [Clostridiales bacterium]